MLSKMLLQNSNTYNVYMFISSKCMREKIYLNNIMQLLAQIIYRNCQMLCIVEYYMESVHEFNSNILYNLISKRIRSAGRL